MADTSIASKLRINPEQRILILNGPKGYIEGLSKDIKVDQIDQLSKGEYEFVQLFASNANQLDDLIQIAQKAIIFDGLLWISYPKGSSGVETDINRDSIWERMKSKGIRPVKQISIDETWSAIRFRPTEQVGKK